MDFRARFAKMDFRARFAKTFPGANLAARCWPPKPIGILIKAWTGGTGSAAYCVSFRCPNAGRPARITADRKMTDDGLIRAWTRRALCGKWAAI
jgi:hypothetical protein